VSMLLEKGKTYHQAREEQKAKQEQERGNEGCTFKPEINKRSAKQKRSYQIHEKLFSQGKEWSMKKKTEKTTVEYEFERNSKECTF